MNENITVENMREMLIDLGVTEEAINLVANINGDTPETMQDILFASFGYRYFSQLKEN